MTDLADDGGHSWPQMRLQIVLLSCDAPHRRGMRRIVHA